MEVTMKKEYDYERYLYIWEINVAMKLRNICNYERKSEGNSDS